MTSVETEVNTYMMTEVDTTQGLLEGNSDTFCKKKVETVLIREVITEADGNTIIK